MNCTDYQTIMIVIYAIEWQYIFVHLPSSSTYIYYGLIAIQPQSGETLARVSIEDFGILSLINLYLIFC